LQQLNFKLLVLGLRDASDKLKRVSSFEVLSAHRASLVSFLPFVDARVAKCVEAF